MESSSTNLYVSINRYGKKFNDDLRKLIKAQEELYKGGDYKMNEIGLGKKRGGGGILRWSQIYSLYNFLYQL